MTEKEVLEMIKESAEKEKMPDALRPEQIKEKLQATKQKKAGKANITAKVAGKKYICKITVKKKSAKNSTATPKTTVLKATSNIKAGNTNK